MTNPHKRHSVLREIIVEHLFVGELLRFLWARDVYDIEVMRSEFDAGGFDLVLTRGALVRHVQMKALRQGGRRASFGISENLAKRPSGCVVCVIVSDELEFTGFRIFAGEKPEDPLPSLDSYPPVRHSKGDATGFKSERPGHRKVPLSRFQEMTGFSDLAERLLGKVKGVRVE